MLYCYPLDLPIEPLKYKLQFKEDNPVVEKVDLHDLNPELVKYLAERNIVVTWLEIFHKKPNDNKLFGIHIDVERGDQVKLNWIYGGSDSTMRWYSENAGSTPVPFKTLVNTPSIVLNSKDTILQHEECLQGPNIVQVGVPHNIAMGNENRHALSAVLTNTKTKRRLTMAESLTAFIINV